MKNCKQLFFKGELYDDYWVAKDGYIWSTKQSQPKRLKIQRNPKTGYPSVGICRNGKSKTIAIHRLVCYTYHSFPQPNGIKKSDWEKTPASVKKLLSSLYQVNHIDHVHGNFHPNNLEWVTVQENSQKYQTHSKTK